MKINFKTTKPNSKEYNYQNHEWFLEEQLNLDEILKNPQFQKFKYCGKIIASKSEAGYEIELASDFKGKSFVIYLIVKNGKILKGGKSKNPLDTRSYYAGTEESWTMRGTPSVTNYVWSQIFRESLKDGNPVSFYGYVVPSQTMQFESFDGKIVENVVSPYEEEEKKLNQLLNKLNGKKVIGEGKLLEKIKK